MIVSHEHRFVFIKTRRTAGSSIEAALAPRLGASDMITGSARDGTPRRNVPDGLTGHVGWRKILALAGTRVAGYAWFCVERNSYAKALSDWLWHRDVLRDTGLPFASYVWERRPTDWDRYTKNDEPVCGVLQYAALARAQDIDVRGIGIVALPRFKTNEYRASCADYYGPEERAAVDEVFAREIAYFKYGMPAR